MQGIRLKALSLAVCAALMLAAVPASAYDEKPFTADAFKTAQEAGKPILVDAFAPWCPTCRAQQKVFDTLKQNAKYDPVTIFKIDFDHQPDALRSFKIQRQSTLIGFKGAKETSRSLGDTNAASIAALLDSTLN